MPPPPPAAALPPSSTALYKQKSWSPDLHRDDEWTRRKGKHLHRRRLKSKSVTDEDIDELKACFELGFGFGCDQAYPELDDRLSTTFPALGLYYAVNKQYHDAISKSSSVSSSSSTILYPYALSEADISSPSRSPHTIIKHGDNPQTVKTRLRQWAQVVACSVRLSSSS